ncbi:MAG: septal ring lytic transglycosylase RlpA family protein [Sporocytophaga sp.]|uniref:septal ring lytic transglycosylase RlpA family protein n=1 Tax=Sporocytophaga sp. TaxID=2231183 RepID=UPI001B08D6E2|nr:septal ring lytic transglycosylase RlpA family protein [Sporocytophaga sp.]MBO9702671.1 septal ring lytic transglycosylase RlpA family protein [Sporocytophaga sp.]
MKKRIFFFLFFTWKVVVFAQTTSSEEGLASYYADKFHGRRTASGDKYNKHKFTAAHRTLPFDTQVKVTNLSNDSSVIVTINDRGPYGKGKIIDLSYCAAKELNFVKKGITKVKIEILNESSIIQDTTSLAETPDPDKTAKTIPSSPGTYDFNFNETKLKGYYIQTGAFKDSEVLSEEINRLQKKIDSNNIYIEVIKVKNTIINRILIGPYEKKNGEAEIALLQKKGITGFLKSY